jgi:hypothetical protein
LTGTRFADVDDETAETTQERLGALECRRRSACHDRERRFSGTLFAAAHGCIDRIHTAGSQFTRDAPRCRGRDRAHIDEQRAGPQSGADAVGSQDDVFDGVRFGQHRKDYIGSFGHSAGVRRGLRPGFHQRRHAGTRTLEEHDLETRTQQMLGHRAPHHARADPADGRDCHAGADRYGLAHPRPATVDVRGAYSRPIQPA